MPLDLPPSQTSLDLSCDVVRRLYMEMRAELPIVALGALQRDGADHVRLTYIDVLGLSGHRSAAEHISPPFLEWSRTGVVTHSALHDDAQGLMEARLLMTGMPEEVRQSSAARLALVLPLPSRQAALVVGLSEEDAPGSTELTRLESLPARATALFDRHESVDEELSRLRRLAGLEQTLGALIPILDFREIFERLSALSRDALRHDFLSVATFSDDLTQLELYARTSGWTFPERGPVQFPPLLVDTFT